MSGDREQNVAAHQLWRCRLLELTRSLRRRDLALHLGDRSPSSDVPPLTLSDLHAIKRLEQSGNRKNLLYHQATDSYLRAGIEPSQAELTTWMNGARAQVDGRDIPFNQVVTWCQNTHDTKARSTLSREVRSLCRFLAPFNHATWKVALEILTEELGYPDYITYCEEKRNVTLSHAASDALTFLRESETFYNRLLPPLLHKVTGLPLNRASRFDAIYLLGMRYLDRFFPDKLNAEDILDFFQETGYRRTADRKRLIIHQQDGPEVQPYCIPMDIPGEIHIVVGPLKGWIDLESFYHELGHALTFLYADAPLAPEQSDFFQSGALSESFAFLFQKLCLSEGFLHQVLALDIDVASTLSRVHAIKWLTLARRYAAKLTIEVDNFQRNLLRGGEAHYAEIMQKETGFFYDPETYLFDLMPDFYSLDYFQAFLGAAALEEYLQEKNGDDWFLETMAAGRLKSWWRLGNSRDLEAFLLETTGQHLQSAPFIHDISLRTGTGTDVFSSLMIP